MNQRRRALKLLLGGIALYTTAPALATGDIEVYHSPD
jgi:hypothetical protein